MDEAKTIPEIAYEAIKRTELMHQKESAVEKYKWAYLTSLKVVFPTVIDQLMNGKATLAGNLGMLLEMEINAALNFIQSVCQEKYLEGMKNELRKK